MKHLPLNLPWKLKLDHKLLSIPLKPINRKKKPASKEPIDKNRENAISQLIDVMKVPKGPTQSTPRAEPAREGGLEEEIAKPDENQNARSGSSQGNTQPKRKKPKHSRSDECPGWDGLPNDNPVESTEVSPEPVPKDLGLTRHNRKTQELLQEAQGKRSEVPRTSPRPFESRKDKARRELTESMDDLKDGIRRSVRNKKAPDFSDYVHYKSKRAEVFHKAYRVSVQAALKSERAQETREAVRGEIQNMITYQVGRFIHFLEIPEEQRKNIIHCFMFIKHKEKPDGSYDKTKARLVGDGSEQSEFMYDMISSSVFMLFNIASKFQCKLATYDIKGAFLHAKFTEEDVTTYIRIPKEVATIWVEMDPTASPYLQRDGSLIMELDKFIYGLKQSPLKFQLLLIEVLIGMGYEQLINDRCLFKKSKGNSFSLLSTHVDDILQVTNSQELYEELRDGLIERFGEELTVNEEADSYLGMKIERSPCKAYVRLTQQGLTDKVLDTFPKKEGDRELYHSPAVKELFDVPEGEHAVLLSEKERKKFLSVLMTLMYLARLTRPDILMPVTHLASRAHCATEEDMKHLQRVVWYLSKTPELGVIIHCEDLALHCHCDASFATHPLTGTGKGHTGYLVAMGEGTSYLHARSGKQKVASISSTEAEVTALVEAMKMCMWLRNVLTELGVTELQPIKVYEDNKSCITLVDKMTSPNNQSRHFISKIAFLNDLQKRGILLLIYKATELMTADVLTKPLHGFVYKKHTAVLLGLIWFITFKRLLKF